MSRKRRRNKKQQKRLGFWLSLEKYTYKRIAEIGIRWSWVGIIIVAVVVGYSLVSGYFRSSPLFGTSSEVIRIAAEKGDYDTARKLWNDQSLESNQRVLGAETELEELVYPERKIEHEILKQEELLVRYPGSWDILVNLSKLYRLTGDMEMAEAYWEQARKLDPNNQVFQEN